MSDCAIETGCKVTLHYSLAFADGSVVDSTFGSDPITFIVGDGSMVAGLEIAIGGMRAGQRETVSIPPNLAFGFPDPEQVHEMALDEFSDALRPEPGLIMGFAMPNGEEIPGTILTVENGIVRVDFNHPLAGHEVLFDAEILDVIAADRALN